VAGYFQALPFQCRMTVFGLAEKQLLHPAAHAFLPDVAATPSSSLLGPLAGLATRFH
jgi:hypothetical protein